MQSLAQKQIRSYTPRHNGKVERYNLMLVDEVLYTRIYASEQARRHALAVWVNHYNYHPPHTACGEMPPASLVPAGVDNVRPSYVKCRALASRLLDVRFWHASGPIKWQSS